MKSARSQERATAQLQKFDLHLQDFITPRAMGVVLADCWHLRQLCPQVQQCSSASLPPQRMWPMPVHHTGTDSNTAKEAWLQGLEGTGKLSRSLQQRPEVPAKKLPQSWLGRYLLISKWRHYRAFRCWPAVSQSVRAKPR